MKVLILTDTRVSLETDKYTNQIRSSCGWIGVLVKNIQSSDTITSADIISVNMGNDGSTQTVGNATVHNLVGKPFTKKPQKNLIKKFNEILNNSKPDLIDIQGIEFSFGRDLLLCDYDCPVIATLQGLPMEISKVYYSGLPKNYKWKRTFFDNISLKGTFEKQKFMEERGKVSFEILKKADYIVGRTDWDHANTWKVNPEAEYFYNARIFRDDFYKEENVWDINKIKRHRIFGIQGRDSAKGLHIGIEALALLKKDYPDIELIVPGAYRYNSSKLRISAYEKYIRNLIKKHNLEDNVKFVGSLNAAEMVDILKTSHAFCQYSMNENSPNSLGEAMILGVPCVASFVGGTPSYLSHEHSGLFYEKSEPGTLAFMLKKVFDNDELATRLSENARKDALVRHDRDNNKNTLFEIYKQILNKTDGEKIK